MKSALCRMPVLLLLFCAPALGEDQTPDEKKGWQRLFREQARSYQIEVGEAGAAKLLDEPVMQWAHPARGGQHGAVFLWVKDGIPITIGTVNIWPLDDGRQRVAHELHSLSQTSLTATWQNRKWTPPADSIEWKPLDSSAAPPAEREPRLRRMRQLADEFSARSRDSNNREWALRRLPRPLYRYDLGAGKARQSGGVADGAIFGFVEGTDLEVVLVMELRHAANGDGWWYAAARMSDLSLELMHGERLVWHVGPGEYDRSTTPYYCATVETRSSPD